MLAAVILVIWVAPSCICCANTEVCLNETIRFWWEATENYLRCVRNSENASESFTISVCFSDPTGNKNSSNSGKVSFVFKSNLQNASCTAKTETNLCDLLASKSTKSFVGTTSVNIPAANTSLDLSSIAHVSTSEPETIYITTSTLWLTTTAYSVIENTKKLDEMSKKQFETNLEDQDFKIIVKYFNGTEFGTTKNPIYVSKGSFSRVTRMKIENSSFARIVVIDTKLDPSLSSNIITSNNSTKTTTTTKGLFGNRLLTISAFKSNGTEEAIVAKTEFDMDISNGGTKSLLGSEDGVFNRKFFKEFKLSCSFSDHESWKETGCEVTNQIPGQKLTCSCDHTTVFAVLMSATVVEIPVGVKVVSYIAEIVSVIFLVVTVALLMKVKNRVRGDRVKVQICVSFSLLILHILNVFHDVAIGSKTTCEMLTVLTHYFLLCSAMWMLMEGITLLFKTMNEVMRFLNGKNAQKFAIFRYMISFTVPGIIVVVSAAVGFESDVISYMPISPAWYYDNSTEKYLHCWISNDMLLGAVIIPIAIVMFCCIAIVMRMCYVVFRMSSESENFKPTNLRRKSSSTEIADLEHLKAALKATFVLLPVLGVPWFLGFFTGVENGGVRKAFMYLNAIINGLQGLFLFFVYCIIGKEVRKAAMKTFIRQRYALSNLMEFSTNRRMTTDQSTSTTGQRTLSTNVAEHHSEVDIQSIKSLQKPNDFKIANL